MYLLKNISFTWNQIVHYQLYMGTILYKMQLRVCLDAARASPANPWACQKIGAGFLRPWLAQKLAENWTEKASVVRASQFIGSHPNKRPRLVNYQLFGWAALGSNPNTPLVCTETLPTEFGTIGKRLLLMNRKLLQRTCDACKHALTSSLFGSFWVWKLHSVIINRYAILLYQLYFMLERLCKAIAYCLV